MATVSELLRADERLWAIAKLYTPQPGERERLYPGHFPCNAWGAADATEAQRQLQAAFDAHPETAGLRVVQRRPARLNVIRLAVTHKRKPTKRKGGLPMTKRG